MAQIITHIHLLVPFFACLTLLREQDFFFFFFEHFNGIGFLRTNLVCEESQSQCLGRRTVAVLQTITLLPCAHTQTHRTLASEGSGSRIQSLINELLPPFYTSQNLHIEFRLNINYPKDFLALNFERKIIIVKKKN